MATQNAIEVGTETFDTLPALVIEEMCSELDRDAVQILGSAIGITGERGGFHCELLSDLRSVAATHGAVAFWCQALFRYAATAQTRAVLHS